MKTQKEVINALKNSKGSFAVFSFDPDGEKRRNSTYSGLDFMSAFIEMSNRLAEGRLIVLTDENGNNALSRMEATKGKRITYSEAYQYSVKVYDDGNGNPIGNVIYYLK